MPTREEMLLEAESRGLLPPEQQQMLDEARNRGLVGQQPMGMGEMFSQAAQNLPESAVQVGKDFVYPFMHPIETADALGNLGLGTVEKVIPGEQSHEKYADAVGQFFAERYGGLENLKKTVAQDPAGFLADVSTVISGGAGLAARAGGTVGRVASRVAHPVREAGKGAAELLGVTTGTGAQPYRVAGRAGMEGGKKAEAFRAALRGDPGAMEGAVAEAKLTLDKVRLKAQASYRQNMRRLGSDPTVLKFDDIDQAVAGTKRVKTYKGIPLDQNTAAVRGEIEEIVDLWKQLDPAEYHTAEGLDALKQKIFNEVAGKYQPRTPERVVAMEAYHAVKDEISKQAPAYTRTMKDYSDAMELIRELNDTLSLNPKAKIDTTVRKLQSMMRNNAYTNYGRRLALGEMLVDAGAGTLMERLAGSTLEPLGARGLSRVIQGGGGIYALLDPVTGIPAIAASSPRVMGEAAYAAGKVAGMAPPPGTLPAIYQTGRGVRESDPRGKR